MLTIKLTTRRPKLTGWKYFWAKRVSGFDASQHCARCLVGPYIKEIGLDMPVNVERPLPFPEGSVLYICGVALPFRWANNFHLAVKVKAGARAELPTYNGDTVTIEGAERIEFNDRAGREHHPDLPESFLTCRNFQFGAQYYS